jgi:hypothetical protein
MKFLSLLAMAIVLMSCGGNKTNLDALNKLDSISNALKESSTNTEKFSSVDGKFKIAFPGTPVLSSENVPTEVGNIEMKSFTYEKSATEIYIIAYSDYPSELVKQSDPETLLNGAKEGALTNQQATLKSDEKITLDGNPGYYFTAVKDTYHMCYKIFLKENRLYMMLMLRDGDYPSKDAIDGFIGSFELIK